MPFMDFGMDFEMMAFDAPMMMMPEAMAFDGAMMEDAAPAPMERPAEEGRLPNKAPDIGQEVNKQNLNADGA